MRMTHMRAALAAAWLAAAVSPLGAGVIFSDINSSFSGLSQVLGSNEGGLESLAAAFTPTANSTIDEAQVKVVGPGRGDPAFDLYLYSNNSGAPGSNLETLGTNLVAPTPVGIVADSAFTPLALTDGTQYWLVMTPFDPNSFVVWYTNGTPAASSAFSLTSTGSTPWTSQGNLGLQFEIDGTSTPSVPEPATVGLVTAGLGLAALIRHRASRIAPASL